MLGATGKDAVVERGLASVFKATDQISWEKGQEVENGFPGGI